MPLRKCPDCKHEVSKRAASCPNCGAPLAGKPKKQYGYRHVFLALVIFFLIYNFAGTDPERRLSRANEPVSPPAIPEIADAVRTDWKVLKAQLIADYSGMIVAVDQLNSSTAWVVVAPALTDADAVEIAESVGYYIRNVTSTWGKMEKPSVHTFRAGKHRAVARPRMDGGYRAELDVKDWR